MKDHDRWLLARRRLESKLETRRSNSRLPALVALILARPILSTGMIAAALGVSPRAAQDMVAVLGLREMTGRRRYRAWGIL